MASDLHRTATTAYLCCVPTMEASAGDGRGGLADADIQTNYMLPTFLPTKKSFVLLYHK